MQVAVGCHDGDEFRILVFRITCIYAVDIAQQYQRFGVHHACYQSAQFIVIGKHQFSDAHGVVFVDDGYHAVFEHHLHTSLLVVILFAWVKVLTHGEYLSHVQSVFSEQVVVESNELHLSQCREQLSLLHGVQVMFYLHLSSTASHGTR